MNSSPIGNRHRSHDGRDSVRYCDRARQCAFDIVRRVHENDAYANLISASMINKYRLNRRDAAFATELAFGTLRLEIRYDAIIDSCITTDKEIDPLTRDVLRLCAHQLLGMRVATHAAVNESVRLARANISAGPAQFVNAVGRRISEKSLSQWLDEITEGLDEEDALALAFSYPLWITKALGDSLVAAGRKRSDLQTLLPSQNRSPLVHLCARPGLITPMQLADQVYDEIGVDTRLGDLSPYGVIISGGDPGKISAVTRTWAGVQDEGSQLVAQLLTILPLEGNDTSWVDLCAGPGGKAALLGAIAAQRGAKVLANELSEHRAELVRKTTKALRKTVTVRCGSGIDLAQEIPGSADRVLVDVPCTGLGSLRRRPEARNRKIQSDLAQLLPTQKALLDAGLKLLRPGGILAYATCSPHLAETRTLVTDVIESATWDGRVETLDTAQLAKQISPNLDFGTGAFLQLWPDLHHSDAMFCALLRRLD